MCTTSGSPDPRKYNIEGKHNFKSGECPSPTYEYTESLGIPYCCCGNGCCLDKCTRDTPPEDCLANIPNSKWYYHQGLGAWRVVVDNK